MNRNQRIKTAYETLEILDNGCYINTRSQQIDLRADLSSSVEQTIHYTPDDFETVYQRRDNLLDNRERYDTRISVTGETTFAAARRLVVEEEKTGVCCLNFASAKNPGGGFLGGAQAQEEALARASGLYASLKARPAMYDYNRANGDALYSDHMIYSPNVPVFRNDHDQLLDNYYTVDILTAPAVNAGALKTNSPEKLELLEPVMLSRIGKLLSLAVIHNQSVLVLGAWGCGVFRNEPADVAAWFAFHLTSNPVLKGAFREVVFAVYDSSDKQVNKKAFQTIFEQYEV
ncbi:uncharacterized protein (TIGR02452 family) [Chitinophaga terrae (ex Kim and Jung 2007)]|uniref:TIGR02452 family protein n=1 Tax=Chitinophaga terrae (ex Kim and Jung 2007) TaxID=408074 RepID=UPI002786BFB6|nr:TIGR02452 family protein [Chitinophaga terrae (ex Kim and Jung 2007)]MDQ0106294.1 uncharacterized protein (TIGR02452 family) [Chitinophaga terrae (ex Kim and Jung 2007)]